MNDQHDPWPTPLYDSAELPDAVLSDVISRGVRAGLISPRTPESVAIRLLDKCGTISPDDRDLLVEAYPEFFQRARQLQAASEFVSPNLEI